MKDYYQVLGVASDAEAEVIAAAYKAMMRKYHPDLSTSNDAAARSTALNEAYETLRSEERRREYDAQRAKAHTRPSSSTSPPPPPPPPPTPTSPGPVPAGSADHGPGMSRDAHKSRNHTSLALLLVGLIGGLFMLAFGLPTNSDGPAIVGSESETTLKAATDSNAGESPTTVATPANPDPEATTSETAALLASPYFRQNVESALAEFSRIYSIEGLTGVRTYSISCIDAFRNNPSVEQLDYCVAFDMAAVLKDYITSSQTGMPQDRYFKSRARTLGDEYESLGASSAGRAEAVWQIVAPAIEGLPSS